MNRTKAKRFLWMLAVLILISFFVLMVVHKGNTPRIIGNIPSEDISEISKAALKYSRHRIELALRNAVKDKNIRGSMRGTEAYVLCKVYAIEATGSGSVVVEVGTGTDEARCKCGLVKNGAHWEVASILLGRSWMYLTPQPWKWKEPTNTMPVSQHDAALSSDGISKTSNAE